MEIKFETHLNFHEKNIESLISPLPIKNKLPDWFINTHPPIVSKESKDFLFESFIKKRRTIKNCMPVGDYLQSGYLIPAWEDMFFYKNNSGVLKIRTLIDEYSNPIERDFNHSYHNVNQFYNFLKTNIFKEYYGEKNIIKNNDFNINIKNENFNIIKLMNPWTIITPKGYSTLFMRPFYHDQKINILPAIVDTDSFKSKINFPFLLNIDIDETYRVNLGDPLILAFPFRRDDWKMNVEFNKKLESEDGIQTKLINYYKKFIRKEKNYN